MTKTNKLIMTIKNMDNTMLMNTDDKTYDKWLTILGNYYNTTDNFRNFIKNRLTADFWKKVNDFYNANKRD